jgi:cytochrome c553
LTTKGPTYSPPTPETTTQKAARNTIADALLLTVNTTEDSTLDQFLDTIDKTNPQTVYRRLVQRYSADETEHLNKLLATIPSLTMKATATTVGEYGELWVATVKNLLEAGAPISQSTHWIKTYLLGLLQDFDPIRDDITRQLKEVTHALPTLAEVTEQVRRWAEQERSDRNLAQLRAPSSGVNKTLIAKIKENMGVTLSTFTLEATQTKPNRPTLPTNTCYFWWRFGQCNQRRTCLQSHATDQRKAGARDFSQEVCSNCHEKGHTSRWHKCPKNRGSEKTKTTMQSVVDTSSPDSPAPAEQTPATVTSADLQRLNDMMSSLQTMISDVSGVVPRSDPTVS